MSNFITLLMASILLIGQRTQINGEYSMDRHLLRVRNQYLRFYIYNKKTHVKNYILAASFEIKDRTNRIYNRVLSKYYDAHTAYYSLPQEDRELIEQIINLSL